LAGPKKVGDANETGNKMRVAVEDDWRDVHNCRDCGGVKEVEGRNLREVFGREV
jgi:hypothetical protein